MRGESVVAPTAPRVTCLPLPLPCSSRAEIAADFTSLDLSGLTAEDDPAWTPEREPMPALIARADAWLDAVSARPEASIAAVSHNDFLTALLFDSSLRLADPELRRKFANAERLSLVLTWQELPPPRRRGLSLASGQAPSGVYGSHAALDTLAAEVAATAATPAAS